MLYNGMIKLFKFYFYLIEAPDSMMCNTDLDEQETPDHKLQD